MFVLLFLMLSLNSTAKDSCTRGKACVVDIRDVHPTQFAVGFAEVEYRIKAYSSMSDSELKAELKDKTAPAVRGPGGVIYITDHHHLARAMLAMAKKYFYIKISDDFSAKTEQEFESLMIAQSKTYLYDENDQARTFSELPAGIEDLKDDPFRSLVYFSENAGCIKETAVLFAEFKWAHFLRGHIGPALVSSNMSEAVTQACTVSKSAAAIAAKLPGI